MSRPKCSYDDLFGYVNEIQWVVDGTPLTTILDETWDDDEDADEMEAAAPHDLTLNDCSDLVNSADSLQWLRDSVADNYDLLRWAWQRIVDSTGEDIDDLKLIRNDLKSVVVDAIEWSMNSLYRRVKGTDKVVGRYVINDDGKVTKL